MRHSEYFLAGRSIGCNGTPSPAIVCLEWSAQLTRMAASSSRRRLP